MPTVFKPGCWLVFHAQALPIPGLSCTILSLCHVSRFPSPLCDALCRDRSLSTAWTQGREGLSPLERTTRKAQAVEGNMAEAMRLLRVAEARLVEGMRACEWGCRQWIKRGLQEKHMKLTCSRRIQVPYAACGPVGCRLCEPLLCFHLLLHSTR